MSLEPMISLADASRLIGVSRSTLRRWLRVDLGITFPAPSRGAKRLLRKIDVEAVVRLHSALPNFTVARKEQMIAAGRKKTNQPNVPELQAVPGPHKLDERRTA